MQDFEPDVEKKPQFEIDLGEEGVSQDAILEVEAKMSENNEKLEKLKVGSCTKSIRNDLSKGTVIFSEEPRRAIYEMGNIELIELKQTSATIQCSSCLKHVSEGVNMCQCGVWLRANQSTLDRIREAFAALKNPCDRNRDVSSRGMKSGHNPWQEDHHKAMDAKRGALKHGKYTSFLDQWQKDGVYRESQLSHGWTDEWVKYLGCISEKDISYDAPYRQRVRYNNTVSLRGVDSNKQAGPLFQRPDF